MKKHCQITCIRVGKESRELWFIQRAFSNMGAKSNTGESGQTPCSLQFLARLFRVHHRNGREHPEPFWMLCAYFRVFIISDLRHFNRRLAISPIEVLVHLWQG